MSNNLTKKEEQDILNKAQSSLILSLGDRALREVSRETSDAAIWKKLESLYMTKFLANRLYLKLRFYSFKMQEGRSIEDQMDEFNKIIDDLTNVDVKIEDKDQSIKLLSSLPKSYELFLDAMLYGGMQTLIMEEVNAALNLRNSRRSLKLKLNRKVRGSELEGDLIKGTKRIARIEDT